jgi:hypothetical protein
VAALTGAFGRGKTGELGPDECTQALAEGKVDHRTGVPRGCEVVQEEQIAAVLGLLPGGALSEERRDLECNGHVGFLFSKVFEVLAVLRKRWFHSLELVHDRTEACGGWGGRCG